MSILPNSTEHDLQSLKPSPLDDSFLSRLIASAEENYTDLSPEEFHFEQTLRAHKISPLHQEISNRLLKKIGDTPFAIDEKIVLFNQAKQQSTENKKNGIFTRWNLSAAAAVAIIGSLAAIMAPEEPSQLSNAASSSSPVTSFSSQVVPISSHSSIQASRDEGVVWRNQNQPHRVIRMEFNDKVITKDSDGNLKTIDQPRVEYVIIPEKID